MTEPTHARLHNGVLTLTAWLPTTQQDVWERITDPARLVEWSPVVPDRALLSTGPATSRESDDAPTVDASVTDVRGPWFLEHRWGPDVVTWQLAPSGEGTQLNLVQELSDVTQAAEMAGGWHVCLDVLARQCAGEQVERVVGRDALDHGWPEARDHYAAQFSDELARAAAGE